MARVEVDKVRLSVSRITRLPSLLVIAVCVFTGGYQTLVSAEDKPSIEVLHFWISDGERKALDRVAEAYRAAGGDWLDTSSANYESMKRDAVERMVIDLAPSSMLWLAGEDVLHLKEMGLARQLNDVASRQGWYDKVHPLAIEVASIDDTLIGVPLFIHNENWAWYNAGVYDELELPLPTSWYDVLAQAPRIAARGVFPIAVGKSDWEVRILFNSLLVSVAGPEPYRRLYSRLDASVVDEAAVREAFQLFDRLREYRPERGAPGSWDDAIKMVIDGRAAMSIMGDWAKGEFYAAGLVPEKDYLCLTAPGAEGIFIAAVDLFVFPIDDSPAVVRGQELLMEIVMDRDIQVDFSAAKGTIPARADIDVDRLDVCSKKSLPNLYDESRTLLSPRLTTPEGLRTAIQQSVASFWRDDSVTVDDLAESLRSVLR